MRTTHFLATLLALAGMSSAQLVVSHMSASATNPTNQPKPYIKIENQGSTAVDLTKITLDYLIHETGLAPTALVADCWFVTGGVCSDLTAEFSSIPLQEDGSKKANLRIRIAFQKGVLTSGQNLTIQWGYHEQSFQRQFNETDDWSFTQANGQWNVDTRVVVGSSGSGPAGVAVVWKGLVPGLPATGKAGEMVHSQAQNASFVHDGSSWVLVSEIGKDGQQGPQGVAGPAGAPGAVGPRGEKGEAGADGSNPALEARLQALELLVANLGGGAASNRIVDVRDGKDYRIATIGGQTWMAENLDYGENGRGSCYENLASNCAKYGRLYDWSTAMNLPASCNTSSCKAYATSNPRGICPEGWRIPTDGDWKLLLASVAEPVGGAWKGREAEALKATAGWNPTVKGSGNGRDAFDFRALPGGYHYPDGDFFETGLFGFWWTASEETGASGVYHSMGSAQLVDIRGTEGKNFEFSVRCVRD